MLAYDILEFDKLTIYINDKLKDVEIINIVVIEKAIHDNYEELVGLGYIKLPFYEGD